MNIYVGNLPLEVTEEELRREFMFFGEVISVIIMNDKYIGSGQPRGYGFVGMASKTEGEAAVISLNGKSLRGRAMEVMGARPLSEKGNTSPLPEKTGRRSYAKGRQRQY